MGMRGMRQTLLGRWGGPIPHLSSEDLSSEKLESRPGDHGDPHSPELG